MRLTRDERASARMDCTPVRFTPRHYLRKENGAVSGRVSWFLVKAWLDEGYQWDEAWSLCLDGAEVRR